MKKLLTILLLTAALTSGAQNIWRAPSVFEQPVNFKAAISQTSGTDSLKITTVDTTSALLHGNGAIRITPTKVTIGNSTDTGYRVSAGAQRFEIQKGNTDSIRLTIVDDTCHVDGTFSAWEFTPPLPGGGGSGWSLTGNSGTNPAVNFIGTTDSVGFRIENSSNEVGFGLQSIKISGHGLNDALGIVIAGESENEEGITIDGYSASQTSVKIYGYTDGASPDWSDIEINAQTGKLKITGINEGLGKVLTSDANGSASWQTQDSLIIDSVATTGDTTQLAGNAFVAIIATGAITDLVLQFPATPYNNMAVTAKFDYAVTTLTADGNGATVYGLPASTVLGLYCKWVYNSATNSWY